ncbi:MAG: Uma2 family endonuclease [Candidatus Solibacter usitatus]|nr:Uma2 family endonuclease [Candidatus Solibacter usitatus]
MATKALVSLGEYLRTSFPDLDREYRDGEIVERSWPDIQHAKTQKRLIAIFSRLEEEGVLLLAFPELRLRISPVRVLIPDVCVFSPIEPQQRFPSTPPLVAIEILSLDDPLTAVREKLEEYRQWGVTHAWLADPHSRRLYTCTAGLSEVDSFHLPEFGIEITPAQIFE